MAQSAEQMTGFQRFIYKRYNYRQFVGIAYIFVVSFLGRTTETLFYIGLALLVVGELIRMWASGHVKKNKVLATDGPYSFVRHPLYVGNFLIMVGVALAANLWWPIPLLILFWVAFYPHTIAYEDNKLHQTFGEQWEQWSKQRNALLPKPGLFKQFKKGEWSFVQSLKVNGEPVIAAILLGCMYVMWMNMS